MLRTDANIDDQKNAEILRDALYLLLQIAHSDIDGAMASLRNSDDAGLKHHSKRIFDGMRLVAQKLKELPAPEQKSRAA